MSEQQCDIGLIGLAVMGENLALNLESRGLRVCVYNRTPKTVTDFMDGRGRRRKFVGATTLPALVDAIARPRKIMMLVKAGQPVDDVLAQLTPLLAKGDVVVDGGNSLFSDTIRRAREAEGKGLLYVGSGVSGGEEGALNGPSLMPGGSAAAWPQLQPIFEKIAARTPEGAPCVAWMGADGAGHFVKMVHNGIEYADMQLIAEAYDLLRGVAGLQPREIAEVFRGWNGGELESFLIEITAVVLDHVDASGKPFVDVVRDVAEQKGTGRWTVQSALDLGVPVTGIAEAVFARSLSGHVEQRAAARRAFDTEPWAPEQVEVDTFVDDVRAALYAAKVVAYAQGFDQIAAGSREHGWDVDRGALATIWRGGCIIRARFLDRIREAYADRPDLPTLLVAPFFADAVSVGVDAWRRVVATAVAHGVPAPAFSSSLAYFDALRREHLPAALVQALRDNFGAHTYERVDREGTFHTAWAAGLAESPAGA